jgi:hypothetical protein
VGTTRTKEEYEEEAVDDEQERSGTAIIINFFLV